MRKIMFAALTLLAALPPAAALAGPRDDVVQGIVRCGAIPDDRQWLDCVYGAAQPMRAQLGLPPAPAAQQRLVPAQGYGTLPGYGGTPPPVPQATITPGARAVAQPAYQPPPPHQDKGFFASLMGEKNVPDITARMTSYSFDRAGNFTVTLANGQTWVQVSGEENHAQWVRQASRYIVTISSGAFGTFNLTVMSEPGVFKVKRVK